MPATIYDCPANPLQQIAGGPGAELPTDTYAATMTVDAKAGLVHSIAGVAATSATCALNTGDGGQAGQLLILILGDTGGVTYTLGANIKAATATVNPTTGKKIVVILVSDGTYFREIARCTAV